MFDEAGLELRDALLEFFQRPVDAPHDDQQFNDLALRIFRYQFERNAPFAAYCNRRSVTPGNIDHWSRIPPVPTAAFREVSLVAGNPAHAQAVFRTSGTTRGAERRGAHHILDLSLYRASALTHFAARVLPDHATPIMLSLVPAAAQMPDSSLAHMIQAIIDELGAEGSQHVASVHEGIDHAALSNALHGAEQQRKTVCLLGTSFSFVHWTDHLRATGETFHLPRGSRLMDTGGYKGLSREVPEAELRETYSSLLGLDPDFCINEYGMTELCSQFYDDTLCTRTATGHARPRMKVGPHWTRTLVADPDSLEPLSPGSTGLLRHADLANLASVLVVQTEDLGSTTDAGFHIIGRAAGAQARGCSIAIDEMLGTAVERRNVESSKR